MGVDWFAPWNPWEGPMPTTGGGGMAPVRESGGPSTLDPSALSGATAVEPTGPAASGTAPTGGRGGVIEDPTKVTPTRTYGGGGLSLTPDHRPGYTRVAGTNSRGVPTVAWIKNDDPRFNADYSDTFSLLDALTYEDTIDPEKRVKPSSGFSNPFEGWSLPKFEYPSFPQYQMPSFPTMPATPVAAPQPTRTSRIRKLTLLTGDDGTTPSTLGSTGKKKTLLG